VIRLIVRTLVSPGSRVFTVSVTVAYGELPTL
jgi:hypothetical protein